MASFLRELEGVDIFRVKVRNLHNKRVNSLAGTVSENYINLDYFYLIIPELYWLVHCGHDFLLK